MTKGVLMKKISIIVPMYYEEEIVNICYKEIKKVLKKIKEYSHEIIFIDDGSEDQTFPLLKKIAHKDKTVKVISFSRNFGHQAALTAGLKTCTGDAAIIIDADLQDPPSIIPNMLKLWEKGYEVVYGKRKTREGESFFKLFTAKLFYRILNMLSNVDIPNDTGDFRLIDRKVINVINNLPEHNKFLRGLYSYIGFKQTEYLYTRQARTAGKTKYNLKKMLSLASDGIISFSYKPLGLIFIISSILLVVSILLFISIFIWNKYYLILLIICLFSLSTSIILFCIYLVSIYIKRIYDETKNRPSYIISETINLN